MAVKKTLLNLIMENSLLAVECHEKEELIKTLYKLFKVGKTIYKLDNQFLDKTIKEINELSGFKRMFLLMRNVGGGEKILEIYCDPEEDRKNSEGEIIESSRLLRTLYSKFGVRKVYDSKSIIKLPEGIRTEETPYVISRRTLDTTPAEKIPEINELMENVEEGRLSGRRREAAHAQRERDRERQRRHNIDRGILCEERPPRREEYIEIPPSVAIIDLNRDEQRERRAHAESRGEAMRYVWAGSIGGGGG